MSPKKMPYARRRSNRTRIRRRTYRSRRRRATRARRRAVSTYSTVSRRPRWLNPLPQMQKYKLNYNDGNFTLSLTALGLYRMYLAFRGNSIYDPDYTGVGCQPYGHDELAALFQLYKVYSSKITVYATIVRPLDSTCNSCNVSIYPTIEAAPTHGELTDILQMPKSKSMVLSFYGKPTGKLTNYCPTRYIYPNMNGEFGLRAQMNANPSYGWQWMVGGSSEREQAECVVKFDVEVTYYCVLSRNQTTNES